MGAAGMGADLFVWPMCWSGNKYVYFFGDAQVY
jgi:hypothetical protein